MPTDRKWPDPFAARQSDGFWASAKSAKRDIPAGRTTPISGYPGRTQRRPLCAHCHRLVDNLTEKHDAHLKRTVYTVKCHGQTESTTVYDDEAGAMCGFTFAFAPRGAR